MAPIVHFVRHAQGYHNLGVTAYDLYDLDLTELGEKQCKRLSEAFPYTSSIDLIVASPLRRTLYTALLSFPSYAGTIVALPELQETSDLPCDTGSDRESLLDEFKDKNIDFSLVDDEWNSKMGAWAPEKHAIEERCLEARRWLMSRPENHIVVVTHGGVAHYLTEDWTGFKRAAGTGWTNTEYRSYKFDPSRISTASLVETNESVSRRLDADNRPVNKLQKVQSKISKRIQNREWITSLGNL